jgi:hypothetical protein
MIQGVQLLPPFFRMMIKVMTPMSKESDTIRIGFMVIPFKFVQRYQNIIFQPLTPRKTQDFLFYF